AGHRTGARGTAAVTLVVIPEAQAEWSRGARYYCEQAGLELGLALVSEFERVLARSDANPLAGAHFRSNARRLVLRGFPFGVVYQLVGNDVYVIGLAHHRRKPGYSERGRKVVSGKSSS
ncbi:MAG: hypothetical protein ORN28_06090, partial [Rhodoferax sp.]|nr:hypothetical protein [Rhodoferax sp.]